jgi:polar amino acid transport system permease protein
VQGDTVVPDIQQQEIAIERVVPERERHFDGWWFLVLAVIAITGVMVFVKPDPFRRIVVFLLDGISVTIRITLIAFVFILLVGLIGGLGRLAGNWLIRGIASLYVEIIRGIPLLVQLLFLYFAFPQVLDTVGGALTNLSPSLSGVGNWLINVKPDPFAMAVAGLTICYGAYMSEIYRAGIQSISKGQMEAARSLGMTYFQSMRYVILPQAVRVILPPVGNEFVALLKDSSLVSVVAVSDMTRRGREFMAASYLSLETWTMVALLYLIMTLFSSRIVALIERKTAFAK